MLRCDNWHIDLDEHIRGRISQSINNNWLQDVLATRSLSAAYKLVLCTHVACALGLAQGAIAIVVQSACDVIPPVDCSTCVPGSCLDESL